MARIQDISTSTEGTFFRCLHDEVPEDPAVIAIRRKWYSNHRDLGLRAKVVLNDDNEVVALCQYIPIEHSHYIGHDLMAILCMWVHGYEHHIGNRQGRGYGRLMLQHIEQDARKSGMKGVAVWGKDFPYWNPVSFYEHMGYERADRIDNDVLVWKAFSDDAESPRFLRQKKTGPLFSDRVTLVSLFTGWCSGCSYNLMAREAAAEMGDRVHFIEVETSFRASLLEWGVSDGILIDGEPYRPDGPPITKEDLLHHLESVYRKKTSGADR